MQKNKPSTYFLGMHKHIFKAVISFFRSQLLFQTIYVAIGLLFLVLLGYTEFNPDHTLKKHLAYILGGLLSVQLYVLDRTSYTFRERLLVSLRYILPFLTILLITHAAFSLVNVYELINEPQIIKFCQVHSKICKEVSGLFSTLKVYRFITLSRHFFVWILIGAVVTGLFSSIFKARKKIVNGSLLKECILHYIFAVGLVYSVSIITGYYSTLIDISRQLQTPFADRYVYVQGGNNHYGWMYTFMQFVVRYTPENAVIFIPPKQDSWEMEGNAGYIRWFIYPRETRSALDLSTTIPDDAQYVLISDGIWWSEVHGWPRESIPAESVDRIWYIDRTTLEVTEVINEGYEYTTSWDQWGLVKLKK